MGGCSGIGMFMRLLRMRGRGSSRTVSALVIGLGNKGPEYRETRHNIGFSVVDTLAEKLEGPRKESRCRALIITGSVDANPPIALAKPQTYMNRSGRSVGAVVRHFGLPLSRCLVVVDDFQLAVGRLRIRRGGSDGGHRGLRSIIDEVGEDFPRLRVGIGPVPQGVDVVDFVLSPFSGAEKEAVGAVIERAVGAVLTFCGSGIEMAMNQWN